MLKGKDEKVESVAALLSTEEKIGSEVFMDSIRNVAVISNQRMDVLFGSGVLYLAVALEHRNTINQKIDHDDDDLRKEQGLAATED